MKIAVCFSGQIRTGVENYQNIREIFGELYNCCDFFIHTWDFCKYKSYNLSKISKKPTIEPAEKFEKFKELYSPKKMIVDVNGVGYEAAEKYGIQALWYSFWKSVELKKEYELENNFKYDYVIKFRTDLVLNFHNSVELLNEIITTKPNEFKILNWPNYIPDDNTYETAPLGTDVFFISKSNEMDIAANYLRWLINQFRCKRKILNLPFYLKSENIKPLKTVYVTRFALLRVDFIENDVLKLNKSEMLETILRMEAYYYASPIFGNKNTFISDLLIELHKRKIKLEDNKDYYLEDILELIKITPLKLI
jgi:hypothetical protein